MIGYCLVPWMASSFSSYKIRSRIRLPFTAILDLRREDKGYWNDGQYAFPSHHFLGDQISFTLPNSWTVLRFPQFSKYLHIFSIFCTPLTRCWCVSFVFPAFTSKVTSLVAPIRDFVFVHIFQINGHDHRQETNFAYIFNSSLLSWAFIIKVLNESLNEICIIQMNEYGFYGMLHSNSSGVCGSPQHAVPLWRVFHTAT